MALHAFDEDIHMSKGQVGICNNTRNQYGARSTVQATCVICLDEISERATALPCRHDQFDFPCLGTWIQQRQVCPLCKAIVRAIRYVVSSKTEGPRTRTFHLPPPDVSQNINALHQRSARERRQRRITGAHQSSARGSGRPQAHRNENDDILEVRRNIYRLKTPCRHVGTNRISQYRNISPASFRLNDRLVARAKAFIRRELNVFDFLNTTASSTSPTGRRSSNAEFLLEYIVSILKSVDLKSSNGHAEELLKDFLGRSHAQLFIHELEAWLRSPYERLDDWDRHVQYSDPT